MEKVSHAVRTATGRCARGSGDARVLVLAACFASAASGCSGAESSDAVREVLAEASHALLVDVGATQTPIGVDATPQTAAGSDGVPKNAEALVAAAAAECGVGLAFPSNAGDLTVSPRLLGRGINVFPTQDTSKLPMPFFGGSDPLTCDEVTEQVEALVCVAGKLNDVADAVGRTEWSRVAKVNGALLVPTDGVEAARSALPWSIRPPADRDRFIARDLALHALAVAARVDATPLTLPSGEGATCTQIYASVAGLGGASFPHALATRAFATDTTKEDYLPGKKTGAARARARLAFEAATLRTGADLLRRLIDTSVQADLAGAAAKRAKGADPSSASAAAWGARDVYDSFAHAARVLGGRLEVGDPNAPARWHDPACSGIGQNQLVDRAYAGGTAGRVLDPAVTSDAQVRAIRLAEQAAVYVPRGALDGASDAEVKSAVLDQLFAAEAESRGVAPSTFAASPTGLALAAEVRAINAADLRFGFDHVASTVLQRTGASPTGVAGALAAVAPPRSAVAPGLAGLAPSRTFAVSADLTSRANMTSSTASRTAGFFTAGECAEPSGIDAAFAVNVPSQLTDAPAYTAASSAARVPLWIAQDAFSLGQFYRRRLVALGAVGNTDASITAVTAPAAASLRAWAGPTRAFFSTATAKPAGWASPDATDDSYVLELQSSSRTDMGLEGVAESDLAAKVTLVIGEPIHADCAIENARGCPADLSPFLVAASAATSVALDPAAFGETSAVRWTFNGAKVRTAVESAAADARSRSAGGAPSRQLFVVGPDPLGTGKKVILGAIAIAQVPASYGVASSALGGAGLGSKIPSVSSIPSAIGAVVRADAGASDAGRPDAGVVRDAGAGNPGTPTPPSASPARRFVVSFPISIHQRDLARFAFDVQSGVLAPSAGGPTSAQSAGSCIEGLRDDMFVSLKNELVQGGSTYEDSWRYYLNEAKSHAAAADALAQQLLSHRIGLDTRLEAANVKLSELCGVTNGASGAQVTGGAVRAPGNDAALQSCFASSDVDLLLYGPVPDGEARKAVATRVYDDLACASNGANPLCAKLTQEKLGVQVVTMGSLGLTQSTLKPRAIPSCEAPLRWRGGLGKRRRLSSFVDPAMHAPTASSAGFSAAEFLEVGKAAGFAGLDYLAGLRRLALVVDAQTADWKFSILSTALLSTTNAELWPSCASGATYACTKTPRASLDALDTAFRVCMDGLSAAGRTFAQCEGSQASTRAVYNDIRWRLEGAFWLGQMMAGGVAAGSFQLPVPLWNANSPWWSNHGPVGSPPTPSWLDASTYARTREEVDFATITQGSANGTRFGDFQGDGLGNYGSPSFGPSATGVSEAFLYRAAKDEVPWPMRRVYPTPTRPLVSGQDWVDSWRDRYVHASGMSSAFSPDYKAASHAFGGLHIGAGPSTWFSAPTLDAAMYESLAAALEGAACNGVIDSRGRLPQGFSADGLLTAVAFLKSATTALATSKEARWHRFPHGGTESLVDPRTAPSDRAHDALGDAWWAKVPNVAAADRGASPSMWFHLPALGAVAKQTTWVEFSYYQTCSDDNYNTIRSGDTCAGIENGRLACSAGSLEMNCNESRPGKPLPEVTEIGSMPLSKRVRAFVNSGAPMNACHALSQWLGAHALACATGTTSRGQGESLPPLPDLSSSTEPEAIATNLAQIDGYLAEVAAWSNRQLGDLYFVGVPELVADHIDGSPLSAPSGEVGGHVAKLRSSFLSVREAVDRINDSLDRTVGRVGLLRVNIEQQDEESKKELTRLHIDKLRTLESMALAPIRATAQIAGAWSHKEGIFTGSAVTQTVAAAAEAAVSMYYDGQALDDLGTLQQSAAATKDLAFERILLEFLQAAREDAIAGRSALVDLKKATLEIQSELALLKSRQSQANQVAAEGLGATYVLDANGNASPIPLNVVNARLSDGLYRRYKAELDYAKRMAFFARRAFEQKIGIPMRAIDTSIGGMSAPSTWVDQVCRTTGLNYDALRALDDPDAGVSRSDWNALQTDAYVDAFIGDYVSKLDAFMTSFAVQYPFTDGVDVALLSLRDQLLTRNRGCHAENKNLLAYGGSLDAVSAADPDPFAAVAGWQVHPCAAGAQRCLTLRAGTTLSPAGTGDAGVAAPDPRDVTWLNERPLEPASVSDAGARAQPMPPPPLAGTDSSWPTGWVSQAVAPRAGTYVLSWHDQARDSSGRAVTANGVAYEVAVFEEGNWQRPYRRFTFNPGPSWSSRSFDFATSGRVRIAFRASVEGTSTAGNVAIAEVQLERANDPSTPVATGYQRTDGTRTIPALSCPVGTPSELRELFTRVCEADGRCAWELTQPFDLPATLLSSAERAPGDPNRNRYNHRLNQLALNVVGTGVRDCGPNPSSVCAGTQTIDYTLEHDAANVLLTTWRPDAAYRFDFGRAFVDGAKAIAAERNFTYLSSSDRSTAMLPGIAQSGFDGRPLEGTYRLRIWDSPELRWDRIDDIQFLVTYRYWTKVRANGNGP